MNHSVRVLIVDDEHQARSLVKKLLADHFPLLLIEEAAQVSVALEKIRDFDPQLIFLDVQMRGETGFDLLDKAGALKAGIIFTTAHSEHALRAFRYSAMNYLIKPLDREEFISAVEKALQHITSRRMNSAEQIHWLQQLRATDNLPDKLTVPTPEGFLFITITDILYCQAVGNYTRFHLTGQPAVLSSYTLGYYEELLGRHRFFRVHRSYLVNLACVKMYKKGDGGTIVMNNGDEIEVARGQKEALLKILKP